MAAGIEHLVSTHGYWLVGLAIGLESMGIPVPGETMLVSAAMCAGATGHLNIVTVIVTAMAGAILGDNLGYLVGRRFGYPLLVRYGHLLTIDEARLKIGALLFDRHGGKVVFFGRFVAVLRALAAVLAGMNRMPWPRFLVFNAAGAVAWAGGYGLAAYLFGEEVERLATPLALGFGALAAVVVVMVVRFVRRHERALRAEAERTFAGRAPWHR